MAHTGGTKESIEEANDDFATSKGQMTATKTPSWETAMQEGENLEEDRPGSTPQNEQPSVPKSVVHLDGSSDEEEEDIPPISPVRRRPKHNSASKARYDALDGIFPSPEGPGRLQHKDLTLPSQSSAAVEPSFMASPSNDPIITKESPTDPILSDISHESVLDDEDEGVVEPVAPTRRRRGRRTAAEMLTAATEAYLGEGFVDMYGQDQAKPDEQKPKPSTKRPAPKETAEGPVRKRGRPPKNSVTPKPAVVLSSQVSTVAQSPKRRGRPPTKKGPLPGKALLERKDSASPMPAKAEPEHISDVPVIPAKRRGRPPKSTVQTQQTSVVVSIPSSQAQVTPAPAKRRGRPPKQRN
ncbi:hypothetical protein NLU13_5296 [Sarocladium strictum]|uniref:AT hook domain-containing protein n=1 Tax=Sarocladium strictum TaxID=5046 RepID=A0AA39GJ33_SARSR|nr:hypothetical protein NLU13_5296 [Sarocladium strictum]